MSDGFTGTMSMNDTHKLLEKLDDINDTLKCLRDNQFFSASSHQPVIVFYVNVANYTPDDSVKIMEKAKAGANVPKTFLSFFVPTRTGESRVEVFYPNGISQVKLDYDALEKGLKSTLHGKLECE